MVCHATTEQYLQSWDLPSLPESQVGTNEWYAVNDGGTHMSTYPAAVSFASWLEREQTNLGMNRPGVAILELGSGQGWLGNVLASNLKSADIVLTDRQEAIEGLQIYATDACDDLLQRRTSTRVMALDWFAFLPSQPGSAYAHLAFLPTPLVGAAFDLIVGTDLFCTSSSARALAWVIRALLEKGRCQGPQRTSAIYGHWCRSPRTLALFLEHCAHAGLTCEDCTEEPLMTPYSVMEGSEQHRMHCTSPDLHAPNTEVMPASDSDGDIDWTQELFKGTKMLVDEPMFKVYRIRLDKL